MQVSAPDFGSRVASLDLTLFQGVPTETEPADRRSLLALQRCVRRRPYTYLEIGSFAGGTLRTHYADPLCMRLYSIDPRPDFVRDIRGRPFRYTERTVDMVARLRAAHPEIDPAKLVTFDLDARDVPHTEIHPAPDLCFIDGEHTDPATVSDFRFCRAVAADDAMIAFHDSNLIFNAMLEMDRELAEQGVPHELLVLEGVVSVMLLRGAVDWYAEQLRPHARDVNACITAWRAELPRVQRANRWSLSIRARQMLSVNPRLYDWARRARHLFR